MPRLGLLLLLTLALFGSACASFTVERESTRESIPSRKKVWVKRNFDDNRFTFVRIVEALRLRGYQVEAGPLTLMPKGTEVIIEYRDVWAWDFKDHMVMLELRFIDPRTKSLLTVANYTHPASVFTEPSAAVDQLLQEVYEPRRR